MNKFILILTLAFLIPATFGCGPDNGTSVQKTDPSIVLDQEPELGGAEDG